jgi:hypothetical protein
MTTQNNSEALLNYLINQANTEKKDWFGFKQQKITGINLAYKMAENHADKLTPDEVVEYVRKLNDCIFQKLIMGSK